MNKNQNKLHTKIKAIIKLEHDELDKQVLMCSIDRMWKRLQLDSRKHYRWIKRNLNSGVNYEIIKY